MSIMKGSVDFANENISFGVDVERSDGPVISINGMFDAVRLTHDESSIAINREFDDITGESYVIITIINNGKTYMTRVSSTGVSECHDVDEAEFTSIEDAINYLISHKGCRLVVSVNNAKDGRKKFQITHV